MLCDGKQTNQIELWGRNETDSWECDLSPFFLFVRRLERNQTVTCESISELERTVRLSHRNEFCHRPPSSRSYMRTKSRFQLTKNCHTFDYSSLRSEILSECPKYQKVCSHHKLRHAPTIITPIHSIKRIGVSKNYSRSILEHVGTCDANKSRDICWGHDFVKGSTQ